jgi:hypothetical protein
MKSVIFKITVVIFCILAANCPLHTNAQAKQPGKVENSPKQEGYRFEQDKHTFDRAYVDKILAKKMTELQHYLTVLIEKKDPNYKKTVDKAMLLFNNDEDKMVTVTNKNSGKIVVKYIHEYLNDVARLPYKSVNITYRNYSAIENIRKQPDGTYHGVAVFEQEFSGYDKEGKAVYHDVVRRNTEVVIRLAIYHKDLHTDIVAMDIFFGNMGVTEM